VLRARRTWLVLGTFFLGLTFPAAAENYTDENPQLVVSVYNDAGISSTELAEAEKEAARIFGHAGIDLLWVDCASSGTHVDPDALVRAGEQGSPDLVSPSLPPERSAGLRPAWRVGTPASTSSDDAECVHFEWPVHLEVRISRGSSRGNSEVFGVAFLSAEGTGCYSNVFYERARELHNSWSFPLAVVMGNVMAHELGHLLLGSNSHASAGIMRARWQGEDLRRAMRADLRFTDQQAESMRRKLIAAHPRRTPLLMSARSSF
jgi:hypothetical protein